MYVIGVTGGIGTGKTTVCSFLRELGAHVLDLDHIGHESYKKGTLCYQELIAAFGETILLGDGKIDRKKFGTIVFLNDGEREKLNAIVRPHMKVILERKLREAQEQGIAVTVIEAAILFEAGWDNIVDEIWVMVAPRGKIIERLKKRNGISDEEIARRMALHYPSEFLAGYADVVLNTDCALSELENKIASLWAKMGERWGKACGRTFYCCIM